LLYLHSSNLITSNTANNSASSAEAPRPPAQWLKLATDFVDIGGDMVQKSTEESDFEVSVTSPFLPLLSPAS
jgi:hypothetical protein